MNVEEFWKGLDELEREGGIGVNMMGEWGRESILRC